MEYLSKSYRFDEEVVAWLDELKAMHGSYNKGLRLVAFPHEGRAKPAIEVTAVTESVPTVNVANLRGTTGAMSAATSKAVANWRTERKPLLKPKERK